MSKRNEVQQRRLDTLCEGVEKALNEGHGLEAAKIAVLKMGKQSSLAALARELKLDRPHLSLCLRLKRTAASVRRALEFNLALPAGGMERVLEILEEGIGDAQIET
jgi:hypothetical protein